MGRAIRVVAALALGLLAPFAARAEGPEEAWRPMQLTEARRAGLAGELARALRARWPKRLRAFTVTLHQPSVVTNGRSFELVAPSGRIEVTEGTIGSLPVTAAIDVEQLSLDYAALGSGRIEVVRPTTIRLHVGITLAQIERLMARSGFVGSTVSWDESLRRLTLSAERPVRFLFLDLRPRFRVSARLTVAKTYQLCLDQVRLRVSGVVGFFARLASARMEERLARRIDLRKDYARLAADRIVVGGGEARLVGPEGTVLSLEFPPSPSPGAQEVEANQ